MMLRGAPLRALRCFAAALMVSLVLAQSLGLLHRSLHGQVNHAGHSHQIAQSERPDGLEAATDCAHGHGWISSLFAHQDGDSVCRLVDAQTSVDGVYFASVPVHVTQAISSALAFSQITSTARAAALFEARAPPLSL